MATMVELPQLAMPTISRLQAIDRPVKRSALSTFMQDILPKVQEGYDAYQKENADRLLALGMNDELNQVQRQVSWMDNRNYNQGKEYQKVLSTQMEQEDAFQTYVRQMAEQGKTAEEIWDVGQKYLTDNVNLVHASDLDSDIKEGLYEANLKRNIAYQKVISDTIQNVAQERFEFNRTNMVAQLYKGLVSVDSAEAQEAIAASYVQQAQLAYMNVGQYDAKEAVANAQRDLTSVVEFWKTQLQDPNQANAQSAARLKMFLDSAVSSGAIPLSTAMVVDGTVSQIEGNILDRNNQIEIQRYNQWELDMESDPTGDYMTGARNAIARIETDYANGSISLENMVARTGKYMDYASRRNQAMLRGSDKMNLVDFQSVPRSLHQWMLDGNSRESFVDYYKRISLSKVPDSNPVGAGIMMLHDSAVGDGVGVAIPELATEGGRFVANSIIGSIMQGADTLGQTEHGKAQIERFEQTKQAYNMMRSQNPALARAFISGFPAEYQDIVETAFTQNSNLTTMKNI